MWPILPYPDIRYPLDENSSHNASEESLVLELVENKIKEMYDKQPVCGVVIEAMQTKRTIRSASAKFYDNLMEICERHNVPFMLDETQSSGWVSGERFLHETWGLERTPDLLTFGGRSQSAGIFYKHEFKPKYPGLAFSTWNGDIFKLEKILRISDYMDNLGWNKAAADEFIQDITDDINEVKTKCSFKITNFRGIGKIFGFDVLNNQIRNEIVMTARKKGFKVNPIGEVTIGFTPALIFEEFHFAHFKEFLIKCEPKSINNVL